MMAEIVEKKMVIAKVRWLTHIADMSLGHLGANAIVGVVFLQL